MLKTVELVLEKGKKDRSELFPAGICYGKGCGSGLCRSRCPVCAVGVPQVGFGLLIRARSDRSPPSVEALLHPLFHYPPCSSHTHSHSQCLIYVHGTNTIKVILPTQGQECIRDPPSHSEHLPPLLSNKVLYIVLIACSLL